MHPEPFCALDGIISLAAVGLVCVLSFVSDVWPPPIFWSCTVVVGLAALAVGRYMAEATMLSINKVKTVETIMALRCFIRFHH